MINVVIRVVLCSALVSATGVLNAQVNIAESRPNTAGFSLLTHEQPLFNAAYSSTAILPRIPSNYDYDALGLFCKLDVQFEKRLKMPLLFRLGDAQSIAAWEGKGVLRKR
ncbi:MAG: hypothetical protein WAR83_11910 [Flavobacteriales bacterium]